MIVKHIDEMSVGEVQHHELDMYPPFTPLFIVTLYNGDAFIEDDILALITIVEN